MIPGLDKAQILVKPQEVTLPGDEIVAVKAQSSTHAALSGLLAVGVSLVEAFESVGKAPVAEVLKAAFELVGDEFDRMAALQAYAFATPNNKVKAELGRTLLEQYGVNPISMVLGNFFYAEDEARALRKMKTLARAVGCADWLVRALDFNYADRKATLFRPMLCLKDVMGEPVQGDLLLSVLNIGESVSWRNDAVPIEFKNRMRIQQELYLGRCKGASLLGLTDVGANIHANNSCRVLVPELARVGGSLLLEDAREFMAPKLKEIGKSLLGKGARGIQVGDVKMG